MGSTPGSQTAVEFTTEQEQVISSLARYMRLVSGLLLMLAVLRIVLGIMDFPQSILGGLLGLLEGALTGILGLVLITAADDARFIVETKGHDRDHLVNTVVSLSTFYKMQLVLGILASVVLTIRLLAA
jgi:hypothetical protein